MLPGHIGVRWRHTCQNCSPSPRSPPSCVSRPRPSASGAPKAQVRAPRRSAAICGTGGPSSTARWRSASAKPPAVAAPDKPDGRLRGKPAAIKRMQRSRMTPNIFSSSDFDERNLSVALGHVANGWSILQLAPGTKRPPGGSLGVYAATTDPAEVERVWSATPDANVGGATGDGFIALDVDPDEGAAETLAELPPLPRTRTHRTPRGEHLIFQAPPGTRGAKLGDGVTVRGVGSYVVLRGSVLADGGRYQVLDDHPAVEAPDWLLERLAIHTPDGGDLPAEVLVDVLVLPRHLQEIMAEVPGVDRSGQVWNLVAAGLEWGLADGEILYLARRFTPAVEKYLDRLDLELARVLAKERPRHQHAGQPCDRAGCPNAPDWMGGPPIPEADFWSSRPVLGHVRDFARARRASPWAVLGAVLVRVTVAVPPFLALPPLVGGPASLNIYVGLVGPSGAGKGAAEAVARDA